jgi:hypothetical protein
MTVPTTPQAKITANSVRIIIDIPDTGDFDWERAHSLWKDNFRSSNMGTAARDASSGRKLGYFWRKVNPRTNLPLVKPVGSACFANMMPMPTAGSVSPAIEDLDVIFSDLYKRIDQLETTILRLKTTNDPKVVITTLDKAELINDVNDIRTKIADHKEDLS